MIKRIFCWLVAVNIFHPALLNAQHIQLVSNINCCPSDPSDDDESSYPQAFTIMNDKLYFFASSKNEGAELWVIWGKNGAPQIVTAINPGYENGVGTGGNGHSMVSLGNQLFFQGITPEYGREVFVSDGTEAGTHILKDVVPGPAHSDPTHFHVVGDKVVFMTSDLEHGWGLWATDGTEQGTHFIKKPNDLITAGGFGNLFVWRNRLYFNDLDTVSMLASTWITDGTDTGTHLLKAGAAFPGKEQCLEYHDKLFFYDNTHLDHGFWITDGTESGTSRLDADFERYPYLMETDCVFNDKIYFTAQPKDVTLLKSDFELWESDGTLSGTHIFCDINGDTETGSHPIYLFSLNDKLYFRTLDNGNGNGDRLMWTDGVNPVSTFLSNNFYLHSKETIYRVDSSSFIALAGTSSYPYYWFYFKDPFSGTHPITYTMPDATEATGLMFEFTQPIVYKNSIFFSAAYKNIGFELYKLDLEDFATAINDPKSDTEMNTMIYPNPAGSFLNIDCSERSTVCFNNILGQQVYAAGFKQGINKIDISLFKSGIYYVTVTNNSGVKRTTKVVKK